MSHKASTKYSVPVRYTLEDFVKESNKIEGIFRKPTHAEIEEAERFLCLPDVTVGDLKKFVHIYQPNAVLRDKVGMDVLVGSYLPPAGAPAIRKKLQGIIDSIHAYSAYETHMKYEALHPFTDCNGRSGRILWLWCLGGHAPLGFLHHFYYQTLQRKG